MNLSLTEIEIAWIAGLLEGEGSFGLDKRSVKRYKQSTSPPLPYIQISMVDEDVIGRFSKLVNKTYYSPRRRTSKGKVFYKLHIGDRKTLFYLLPRIFPYLGKRRQQSVQECLDALEAWVQWYASGGRSKMARLGPQQRKTKNKKLVISKSKKRYDIT